MIDGRVGSLKYQLRRRLRGNGPQQLRLHLDVEVPASRRGPVIILAERAYLPKLAIDIRFVRPDVANDLAKFGDSIGLTGRFQPSHVHDEALRRELNQFVGRPAAKECGLLRGNPVAD